MMELVALNLRDIKSLRQSEMPTKGVQVGKTTRWQANNKRRALPAQSAIVREQKPYMCTGIVQKMRSEIGFQRANEENKIHERVNVKRRKKSRRETSYCEQAIGYHAAIN